MYQENKNMEDRDVVEVRDTPGWIMPAVLILAIVSLAGLGLAWYDSTQLRVAQESFGGQMKTVQQNTTQQIAALEQKQGQTEAANAELQGDLSVVTKRLRITQGDLKKASED